MRKILAVLLLLVSTLPLWSADPPTPVLNAAASTAIDIHAFNGSLLNVSITPLPSTGLEGVPFDVMASDVWYRGGNLNSNTGRLIATWSLRTNVGDRNLTITANPLVQKTDKDGNAVSEANATKLFYRLSFGLNYFNQSKHINETKYLYVYSTSNAVQFTTELDNYLGSTNMPIVSSDQGVRIILVKPNNQLAPTDFSAYLADDRLEWNSGMYEAVIEISIVGGS